MPLRFSNHWKWVVLLIVLVLAFVFFLVGGFWLKRRLRRRRDVQRFSGTGALRTANSPSPFASGVLAPSDGAYMGSRNHPPMSAVPGAGSAAAMERYGSGTHIPPHTGYSSERSPDYAVPSPPPGTATRNLPWMSRNNSGESGRSQRSKRERPGANTLDSPVSPVEGPDEIFPVVGGGKEKDLEEGGIKKKLSRKSRR